MQEADGDDPDNDQSLSINNQAWCPDSSFQWNVLLHIAETQATAATEEHGLLFICATVMAITLYVY